MDSTSSFHRHDWHIHSNCNWCSHNDWTQYSNEDISQCNAMQCNTIQYMQCNATQRNTTQYNTIQYDTQHNTIQYNTIWYRSTITATTQSSHPRLGYDTWATVSDHMVATVPNYPLRLLSLPGCCYKYINLIRFSQNYICYSAGETGHDCQFWYRATYDFIWTYCINNFAAYCSQIHTVFDIEPQIYIRYVQQM